MKKPPAELAARLVDASDLVLRIGSPPSFDELARETGVSRATLYYYFSGRDDLVAFVLLAHVGGGADAMRAADPGTGAAHERLAVVLRAAVDHLAERPRICLALLAAASGAGRMGEVLELNDRLVVDPLRVLLSRGHEDGDLEVPYPSVTADALTGALMLAVAGAAARDGGLEETQRRALVEQLVDGVRAGA